jgi:hypothetical protein
MRLTAHRDHTLTARLVARLPMRYAGGADAALDRPAHVRAGSGVARVGGRLAVIQDDAAFLALVDPATGLAEALPLPADDDGRRQFETARGNKHRKYDLEACVMVGARLLGFGSGSTPRREHVLVATLPLDAPDAAPDLARAGVALVHAGALYAALRAERAFAGSELNVEGAALLGDRVRLFGRGNGAAREGVAAVSATCDLDVDALLAYLDGAGAAPALQAVRAYDLGALEGTALAFTDACLLPDGTLCYAAAAERSPNVVDDGEVVGAAIGLLDAEGAARWTPLLDLDGAPFRGKVEGVLPADAEGTTLWVVTDVDDPRTPSELGRVALTGR